MINRFLFQILLVAAVVVSLASQGLYHFTDLWLSAWTDKTINSSVGTTVSMNMVFDDEMHNIILYCILAGGLFVGALLRTALVFQVCLRCSIFLHDHIFKKVRVFIWSSFGCQFFFLTLLNRFFVQQQCSSILRRLVS